MKEGKKVRRVLNSDEDAAKREGGRWNREKGINM